MKNRSACILFAAGSVLFARSASAQTPPPAGGTGTIKGRVAFTGKPPAMAPLKRDQDPYCAKTRMNDETVLVNKNGTLQNVLVRLANVAGTYPIPSTPAVITQEACMYRPRVQGIVAGQALRIKNGDGTLHNVHVYKGTTTVTNQAQVPSSPPIEKKYTEAGLLLKFKCDVHPWMAGYVGTASHPFFAVTGDDGSFVINGVPAGDYTVEAWHEKYGAKTTRVTVAAGGAATAAFSYSAADPAK